MALFDSMNNDSQQPQKNQYLQSNPNTDANANTSWMSPSDSTGNNSGNVAQSQPNPPSQVSNGTMLGSIAQGNGGGMQQSNNPNQWIDNELKSVNSTDDPNYWYKVIAQHGDTNNPAAMDYWKDRIRRGDGSSLVASGQLQKFQDSGSGNDQQSQLMQLLQQLLGGGQGNMQQSRGAMPYNQYAGQKLPSFGGAQPSSMIGVGNTGITGGMIGGQPMPQQPLTTGPTNAGSISSGPGQFSNGNIGISGGSFIGMSPRLIDPSQMSYLGGGQIDPVTGQRRNPLPGEPQ